MAQGGCLGPVSADLVGNFDQIAVRVAQIDGLDRSGGAIAGDGTFDDLRSVARKMLHPVCQRGGAEKTQVRAACRRPVCVGLKGVGRRVQIDLVKTKLQRCAGGSVGRCEGDRLHPENGRVKRATRADVRNGQDKVIQMMECGHLHWQFFQGTVPAWRKMFIIPRG